MTIKPEKILYTAHATSTGGRAGTSKSDDGALDVRLTTPKGLGGDGAPGTNPEQMFAAGYSACFIGAMKAVAGKQKIKLPDDTSINASVAIGPIPQGFGIQVWLKINVPDMDKAQVQQIVDAAHVVCPYSNATRGNVDVSLEVV
jgi:osmotically inducible protein OsmC